MNSLTFWMKKNLYSNYRISWYCDLNPTWLTEIICLEKFMITQSKFSLWNNRQLYYFLRGCSYGGFPFRQLGWKKIPRSHRLLKSCSVHCFCSYGKKFHLARRDLGSVVVGSRVARWNFFHMNRLSRLPGWNSILLLAKNTLFSLTTMITWLISSHRLR